jgi:hypothetical protein
MTLPGVWGEWGGYLAFFLAGFLVSEPWRWAGAIIGRTIDPASEVFAWVRAVSTAIVAALCARLLVFPTGALAQSPLGVRVLALAVGIAAYFFFGRRLGPGIGASLMVLLGGLLLAA